jgi:hypothetical protein
MRYLGLLSFIVFSAMISLMVLEFMVGCGETTYHADRTYTTNECLFIPYTPLMAAGNHRTT